MKARMGDRSRVPPMGGMMPLKRFRYGSHSVLHGKKIQRSVTEKAPGVHTGDM